MTLAVEAGKRIQVKNVLFGTDFSTGSKAALQYALLFARRYGATLHVAHVLPTVADMVVMSPEFGVEAAAHEDQRVRDYLEQMEKQLQGVTHRVMTPKGGVAEELSRIVEEQEIDLMVLGTHGRTGVRKLVMGSVAEDVFRRAACPVLSVGPNVCSQPDPDASLKHILFATDFSESSLAALPYAISFAEEDESELTLLNVVEQPAAGVPEVRGFREALLRRLRSLVPAEAESWCHPHCVVEFGELFAAPARAILNVAKHGAVDLIVLGVRPMRRGLSLATHLSTTTAQVLTQAACPVLTVRR